jgi:hypothetical protein
MKKHPYRYMVIYNPKDPKEDSKVLIPDTTVLAEYDCSRSNDTAYDTVRKIATRAIPKEYEDKLDQCDIFIRGWL